MKSMRGTSFRSQLAFFVAAGILCIALFTSLANSWQGSRHVRDNMLGQGLRIAENLASQSRLALLYGSTDNAEEAVKTTLMFPDVVTVEIGDATGKPLVLRTAPGQPSPVPEIPALQEDNGAFLEQESEATWRFVAPVLAGENETSPFEAQDRRPQMLGYVRVTQSKATLTRHVRDVFIVNLSVSLLFATVFLILLRYLAARLMRPLASLAETMARAQAGETGARAGLDGPRDIAKMAEAFNGMMAVLEERERELRNARDNALQYAKLKAEFATTVSHEIRTPLNSVIGTLDMLRATSLPSRQREFVGLAWDSSQYLLELINNILDFSKLEAGKVAIENRDFDLVALIEEVLEMQAAEAQRKGLAIGYLAAPGLPETIRGDQARLKQVLMNLVGNALKFTEAGEVSVEVVPLSRDDQGLGIRIEVADTGIGIGEDARDRIFESFAQADTSTTRRFGGTGLGLAISRQLVELMGGSIGVDSISGKGSRFWFTVRCQASAHARADPDGDLGKGRHVLLVVTASITRRFLEQNLSSWGFSCRATQSVDEALSILRNAADTAQPFAFMLMEAELARAVDGELSRRMRADRRLEETRVVLLHDYGLSGISTDSGADACLLSKPLRIDRLRACLAATPAKTHAISAALPILPQPISSRILVVEDNRSNQVIAEGMLQMLGCQVELADGGQDALIAFKRESWDLILMDCNMPGIDGYEATAAIRSLETDGMRTPIVAMTANTQPADIEKCLAAGMDDHLAKPLTLDSLADKLGRWVAGDHLPPLAPTLTDAALRDVAQHPLGVAGEPIDAGIIARLHDVLGSAIGDAIRPFIEDMPKYIERIEQAAIRNDAVDVARAAHAIKGAAGNLGALQLAAIAKDIESRAERGKLNGVDEAVTRLTAEYGLARQALIAEMGDASAAAADDAAAQSLVLVVDDDRSTRATLRHSLQRVGFRVEEAGNGREAIALLGRIHPDVVLMDAMMPEMDGFAACAHMQELQHARDIPVLMITALEDAESIERAFLAGARDYIPKPIHFPVVHQRVKRMIEATRAQHHVRHLAFNDALTGLPNRALLTNQLKRMIESATLKSQSLAILILDLDRFKFVNDTLGHEIGDRLLKLVARRLQQSVRMSDHVARLGGDEFTVVIEDLASPGLASVAAQKINRALSAPFEIDGHELFVSTSIGISVYPDDGIDVSTLLRHADAAMYRAKKNNAGFQFYEATMESSISEHVRMESELRRAIERDELIVYYQPVTLANRQVFGVEALVRWRHPTRGMISPGVFIPLAEETGLIGAIGEWVLRQSCLQARQWLDRGMPLRRMAVNLSGKQLQQPGIAETVESVLKSTGLPPQVLMLEITESVVMEHAHETIVSLQRLKDLGIGLAIDDFGTGYSSLSYLKRFPVDLLKIDQSFVRDIPDDADDAAIVTGIIALAHSLRLKVVAEGVETTAQEEFLIQRGCNYLQGYLISQPQPPEALENGILAEYFVDSASATETIRKIPTQLL